MIEILFLPLRALYLVIGVLWDAVAMVFLFDSTASRVLENTMSRATSYHDWRAAARLLDEAEGFSEWQTEEDPNLYSSAGVAQRIRELSDMKKRNDYEGVFMQLRNEVHRSTLGLTNTRLYQYRSGTKTMVRTYVNLLQHIIMSFVESPNFTREKKLELLGDMEQGYGNSALLLNGSIALGGYHLGVVKGLIDRKLLPRVIFGSNTGAIVAACICCRKDILEALDMSNLDFQAFSHRSSKGSLFRKLKRLVCEGTLMDVDILVQFVQDNIGNVTFLEAYEATGKILNIHVGKYLGHQLGTASWLLNYVTTPNVLVCSAAVASCATFGVYKETPLLARAPNGDVVPFDVTALKFSSSLASFHVNDAVERMRELFGVKMFIVSECNVSQLPFLRFRSGSSVASRLIHIVTEEFWRFTAFMSRLPALRSRATGTLQTMTDTVQGDVVVYPASRVSDVLILLKNPDQQLLEHCLLRGQQQLWPHVELIRTHLSVELAIHDVLDELRESPTRIEGSKFCM